MLESIESVLTVQYVQATHLVPQVSHIFNVQRGIFIIQLFLISQFHLSPCLLNLLRVLRLLRLLLLLQLQLLRLLLLLKVVDLGVNLNMDIFHAMPQDVVNHHINNVSTTF